MFQAVITGDLVSSSEYSGELIKQVVSELKEEFVLLEKKYGGTFALWRGDSFQGTVNSAEDGLWVALRIKALINKTHPNPKEKGIKSQAAIADARISIAIGEVLSKVADPAASNDETFVRSGRKLDSMKQKKRTLVINSETRSVDRELEVELSLLEQITERWSIAAAEVVYYKLSGMEDREIADLLDISLPAVYKRKKIAGWNACELLLKRYRELIMSLGGYGV